ncbi:MAG: FmdB family transcriptional regulator [Omnitrophica bacterium RIFCSPLOWO2_12_FULL_50_11]|nr:MAG: FmdB family transcriptional regulator [Omnitrophica bacterium RIFCSPLOWO2_12_FULL_50_11]
MPTYEYECEVCFYQFERFQPMTARPIKTCPACKGKVRRLIGSGAGILFKGTGFYQTDYRSESYRKKAEAEKKPKSSEKASDRSPQKLSDTKSPTP